MPTLVRAVADERDALLAFLAEQRAGLRRSVHGLADDQARARPSASELCLGGLIKHVALVERTWVGLLVGDVPNAADHEGGLTLAEDESLAGVLVRYQSVAELTEAIVTGFPDLDRTVGISCISPLMPPGVVRTARWILFHVIEETSRHAGHADIIRESLDGATAFELVVATGAPFFT